jgi:hypothetical protein
VGQYIQYIQSSQCIATRNQHFDEPCRLLRHPRRNFDIFDSIWDHFGAFFGLLQDPNRHIRGPSQGGTRPSTRGGRILRGGQSPLIPPLAPPLYKLISIEHGPSFNSTCPGTENNFTTQNRSSPVKTHAIHRAFCATNHHGESTAILRAKNRGPFDGRNADASKRPLWCYSSACRQKAPGFLPSFSYHGGRRFLHDEKHEEFTGLLILSREFPIPFFLSTRIRRIERWSVFD